MSLTIVILAAGQGSRMQSSRPKVLHTVGGKSLLEHVIHTAQKLNPVNILVVHGNGSEQVRAHCSHLPVRWVYQENQLGTAHAVHQALPHCGEKDRLLVLYGDVPLIQSETLIELINKLDTESIGLLVADVEDPTGLGRIIRNAANEVIKIVEERDATDIERHIREINTGIISVPAPVLRAYWSQLSNHNAQAEYYLTDVIHLATQEGRPIRAQRVNDFFETAGINTKWQLTMMERAYQQQQAKRLTELGVIIMDPLRIDIRGDVFIEKDVVLDVNVILEGHVKIGEHSRIGPHVILKNTTVGKNVEIRAHCVIENAIIEDDCVVGPFAHLRPDTYLKKGAKVGNFVEIKKSTLGEGSKANHLSYIGDASVGARVNIGAGTITCNYDGANKHPTIIEDNAFIGSNSALVAPVTIGKDSTVGAGSVITKDVPDNQLGLARVEQKNIAHWRRPKKS